MADKAMNKGELVEKIANEMNTKKPDSKEAVTKSDAQRFFDAFQEVVTDSLNKEVDVQITGFGKFYVQKREAREGINPQTKSKINIAASKVPKFTAGNALKDAIK